ncbi:hypothetical protein CAC42_3727 [Sphaceloma murrayae]|uniref:Conserved oligomeric Golgi complex subunit 1 n=1 Tax=Sphaceloma murrayae TaxID=2082308 RepID=A0A2K1QHP0_9PEZI|nr:hypothetical protein CAC42_3727 [Sphaceloma murrayae]
MTPPKPTANMVTTSMANQAPDPKELAAWEDAFEYPVPVVRKLEQQLRVQIHDNREKVRSLVGSSYRDLLGTADRIIDMNDEMRNLEDVFSEIGQKCNSRTITKLATNHARLLRDQREERVSKRRPAAEAALLQACLSTCQKTMATGGDFLLAARLLLLARLAQNSASKTPQGKRMVSEQRLKVNTQRNRLLSFIHSDISDPHITRIQMLDLLLAHALVTSSSLADVFRHLLRVRQQAISDLIESQSSAMMKKTIDLLFVTLEQVRAIFPRRMSETVERITGPQLLADPALRTVLSFDLSVYERWISPEIRNYVPWLRNNDLDTTSMSDALKQWSSEISKTILSGLSLLLDTMKKSVKIAKLRERTIRHLLEYDAKASGFDKEGLLMAARDLFAQRLSVIISSRSSAVTETLDALLKDGLAESHNVPDLWSPDLACLDLRNGANLLREQIFLRNEGHDPSLTAFSDSLTSWSSSLDDIRKTIKDMQSLRWADSLDLDTDIEEQGEKFQEFFSREDPETLKEKLATETHRALEQCLTLIEQAVKSHDATEISKNDAKQNTSVYLLRLLRLFSRYITAQDLLSSSAGIVRTLYANLAISVINNLQAANTHIDYGKDLLTAEPAAALWTGTPLLPVQPGSRSFRLLRDVSKLMNVVGGDIWGGEAVAAVKQKLIGIVSDAVEEMLKSSSKEDESGHVEAEGRGGNGTAKTEGNTEGRDAERPNEDDAAASSTEAAQEEVQKPVVSKADRCTQALFDVLYLQQVLDQPVKKGSSDLANPVGQLRGQTGLDDAAMDRLSKSAQAYHKRTYLLFGVLAGP